MTAMERMSSDVTAERTVTQRGVDRALRVAWTLADLDGRDLPTLEDVASACEEMQ